MIDSVPLRAPTSPPDTGASSACTPREPAASATSRASDGSLDVMSTTTASGAMLATTPRSPSSTSRTSLG